jgi:ribosomal protein S12 methylthiotransferase
MINRKDTVSVITLGCSKNTVDSERLLKQLQENSLNIREDPNTAGTVIINTCGFIDAAKEESINTILNAVALKQEGRIQKVIVAGCLSERYKFELKKEIPEVDAYFGTEDYEGIITEVGGELKKNLLGERRLTEPAHTAYLKISEGCDHPCSFCAIPLMRGKHRSKPPEELIMEAEFLARSGTKELILIAQDTTDYGKDIYGQQALGTLLNKLSEIEEIVWIRLMYTYPSKFPDDVIDIIAENQKICKYIDIPLQHISDSVLKSMRRGVTSIRIKELLYRLRERIPSVTLRTTLIAGYPTETDKEFHELCDFIREIKFDRLGVFTYSMEENTSSYLLGDPIPVEIKNERKEIIMEIQKEISLEKNKNLCGKQLKVLVDRLENKFYAARSYREAPEVDGEILIPFYSLKNKINIGQFFNVEITDYNEYDLFGSIVHEGIPSLEVL